MCFFSSKCKFWKHCSLYKIDNVTCNKDRGDYALSLWEFRPAGCYRQFEKDGKNCKYWVKRHEKTVSTIYVV
jgi:hypothetical protein